MISPVTYSTEFPTVGIFDDNIEGLTKILITKPTDWDYEYEYRITKINGYRTAVTLPDHAIVEIVLGYKVPDHHKQEVVGLARQKFPHARLFQSQMNLERFKLHMMHILTQHGPAAGATV